jgi:signal transduction histidine kinase
MGLRSMESRILAIGGSLEIHSEPGRGTRVEVMLP